jgi:aspartate-semialdehyde dehydrogenase
MPSSGTPLRFAVVGATSLRGKELVDLLKDRFPAAELKLFDEEISVMLLTDAGGEPAVVQSVQEDSFQGAQIAFFAGRADLARRHTDEALRAEAKVIDLTGGLRERPDALLWIPSADAIFEGALAAEEIERPEQKIIVSPSAPAIVATALAAALGQWKPTTLSIVFLQPVSERGQEGIEELERQTVGLLSFQSIAQPIFDAQVAFNVMDSFGEQNAAPLEASRASITRDVAACLGNRAAMPAIKLLQVPVFHSYAFTAFAELTGAPDPGQVEDELTAAGFRLPAEGEKAPTTISAAGEARALLGRVERDPNHWQGYWFWGVADNLRVSAENAVAIAERIVNSGED